MIMGVSYRYRSIISGNVLHEYITRIHKVLIDFLRAHLPPFLDDVTIP